jgi:uncharacterized protein YktB (UPF0637 family)
MVLVLELSKQASRSGRGPHLVGLKSSDEKRAYKNKAQARTGSGFWSDPIFFYFFFLYYYAYQN